MNSSGHHESQNNPRLFDGPASPHFQAVKIVGNIRRSELREPLVSSEMVEDLRHAPAGDGTAWGIPFRVEERVILAGENDVDERVDPFSAKWIVFLHTADIRASLGWPARLGVLNEHAADYVIGYHDGTEEIIPVRQRHQIGVFEDSWGFRGLQCVEHHKPLPLRQHHEQAHDYWGATQKRVERPKSGAEKWLYYLFAWENRHPEKVIQYIRFRPVNKIPFIVAAISAGNVSQNPLRWDSRRKAMIRLSEGTIFNPELDSHGLLSQMRIDLGQVISATPRPVYPAEEWESSRNNKVPDISDRDLLIEYTAHPDACIHIEGDLVIPLSSIPLSRNGVDIRSVAPSERKVTIRVIDKKTRKQVAVKLHVHGEYGEYLAPVNRHRIPNNEWFEDYSVDFVHEGTHYSTYISGETSIKLPPGKVYVEISRGFEVRPVRKIYPVTGDTDEIIIEIDSVLPWREKGWVTADTHVHFLSPATALIEGAAEGVNVVNLLASQWGELMTNVGDFDGKTTFGSKEAGGDGEYLVRVGSENRQYVLGHISLLGYTGNMITPLTTGGPDESALGDPLEILMTQWAEQCIVQDGLVIVPHFPRPPIETAAAIVSGNVHGVEMTSWGDHYSGIDPYSLSDWYRYLNCGYFVAAVGGTDKMSAGTAVGTVRTYARVDDTVEFTYESWKEAVKSGHTFVTYGPLMEFSVDGVPMGGRIEMPAGGGSVDVEWDLASVTIPISRVELIVNGEIRESMETGPSHGKGHWRIDLKRSSWLALLVRGHHNDKPEIIAAHSSPVMVHVEGTDFHAAADALSILEQIEGALAYLDTLGTRADDVTYKKMRMRLQSIHREMHNRMHQMGCFHQHTPGMDHPEHREG